MEQDHNEPDEMTVAPVTECAGNSELPLQGRDTSVLCMEEEIAAQGLWGGAMHGSYAVAQREGEASEGGGTIDVISKTDTTTSRLSFSVRMYAFCLLASAFGSSFRAVTLICTGLLPSIPMHADGYNFTEMWASCRYDSALYPNTSPGGAFYQYVILADHFWTYVGGTTAFVSGLHVMFPDKARVMR